MYKITAFDPATARLTLELDADHSVITVDLPIDGSGNVPSGPELQFFLRGFIPTWHLERQEALAKGIKNAADVLSLLEVGSAPERQPDPVLDALLPDAVSYAQSQIDIAASQARARFITPGCGQEMTYLIKQAQAQAFADAGYQGEVPSFIAAESALRNVQAQAVADEILAVALQWQNVIGPQIEAVRLAGKGQAAAQVDVQGVDQVMRSVISQLQAIHP